MKLWLASYPRSGNTFIRNILYECYQIESSTFDLQIYFRKQKEFNTYVVVKTHELFENLPMPYRQLPSVYIIRDGRDAIVSQANQSINYKKTVLQFHQILIDIITDTSQSHYGGWSSNVNSWSKQATCIIRFEDLIENPILAMKQIENICALPKANFNHIPTFDSQRNRATKYGNIDNQYSFFFNKGKTQAWRDDMPAFIQELFMYYHGTVYRQNKYDDMIVENNSDSTFRSKVIIVKHLLYGKKPDYNLYRFLLKKNIKRLYYLTILGYYMSREILYVYLHKST